MRRGSPNPLCGEPSTAKPRPATIEGIDSSIAPIHLSCFIVGIRTRILPIPPSGGKVDWYANPWLSYRQATSFVYWCRSTGGIDNQWYSASNTYWDGGYQQRLSEVSSLGEPLWTITPSVWIWNGPVPFGSSVPYPVCVHSSCPVFIILVRVQIDHTSVYHIIQNKAYSTRAHIEALVE